MKRLYFLILVAVAALSLSAQSEWGSLTFGDPETMSTYNGSYFDMAPTNFYLAHTGSQMLYTAEMLAEMNDGVENVRINGISFMFYNETFEDISRNVRIYMLPTDATEFAVVDGVKQFFPLGDLVWEEQRDYGLSYSYGEDLQFAFRMNYPYTPGKGLVVTIVCDALDDDNCTMGSDYTPFYSSGIRGKAMTYTNNTIGFEAYAEGDDFPDASATLGCGTNVDLPYTVFQYMYDIAPTEKTQTPDGKYEVVSGQHEVVVTITPYEGDAFYRIIYTAPDGTVTEGDWTPYVDSFSVFEDGHYRIEFYAKADGKLPSDPGAVEFTVSPITGIEEMTTDKAVAGVRYYNAVGQEMQEANGMTIVVTTYTDGTTSAVKVMK